MAKLRLGLWAVLCELLSRAAEKSSQQTPFPDSPCVGPLFEPFLAWLYKQPLEVVRSLSVPKVISLRGS